MNRRSKLPSLVVIVILTAITAFFWMSFSIYRVFTNKPSPVVPEEVTRPVPKEIDKKTIEELETKLYF